MFNKAGEVMAKHGLKFFYHCHGYEFQPYGQGTLFDLLMQETDPKLVSYEMDIFWVVFPNQDPVKLFQKYGPLGTGPSEGHEERDAVGAPSPAART